MKTYTILLNVLVAVALSAMLFITPAPKAFVLDPAPKGFSASDGKPWNIPSGIDKGCVKPVKGVIPKVSCVVDQDGNHKRISFDTAWRVTHDKSWANNVWVVGVVN